MKLVTFNNLIPSHSMKFILWHDVEDSDADVQKEDPEDVDDLDDDEGEVDEEEGLVEKV